MKKNQKLADLIQGIEDLLSKGRYPLTGEDEVLLKSCLTELRQMQSDNADVLGSIEKVTKWLLLLFEVYDKFKDLI
ncbi:hypothetical protein [uncultured Alistipes sp.]|uniref:hypothetical protein n=1 Tax=uncultured Alistipes sp. TaxID=538949 RepID=UPI002729E9EF|nr:hypothetical protein [uncultured Alistipes sp.]